MARKLIGHVLVSLLGLTATLSAAVQYIDRGDAISLDNGLLTMVVEKQYATIRSLVKDGQELLMPVDSKGRGRGYIQMYSHKGFAIPNVDDVKVCAQTSDTVDVAFRQDNDKFPFAVDVHYVMRSGVSGFYNYLVVRRDPAKVPEGRLAQHNICLRMNDSFFTHTVVGDEFYAPLVPGSRTKRDAMIMDATFRMDDGSVYSKYDRCAREDKHRFHGVLNDTMGAWIVQGSGEHLTGGPTTQELTTHNGILLRHFTAGHFGSGAIEFVPGDPAWEKLGGPWLVYINTGANQKEIIADVKRKADEVLQEWPYQWLKHPLYELERGTVKGRLKITDGTDPAGSLVILAQPEDESKNVPQWQMQGKDFYFWSWAEYDGGFTIENVRPNTYSLYILNDALMGEKQVDGIKVEVDKVTKVGKVEWQPDVRGAVLWQIGVPDRTAGEFLHGDEPRQWGRWLKFEKDFPSGLKYVVGESDWKTDWNYVHPAVQQEDGSWRMPTWQIVFNADKNYSGKAYLRFGIAGVSAHAGEADGAKRWSGFTVKLNGELLEECRFYGHDSAATRSGIQGRYREKLLEFDAAKLRKGVNTIELQLTSRKAAGIKHNFPYASIMYDCIRLEVAE